MSRTVVRWCVVGLFFVAWPAPAQERDVGRQILEGFLKRLVEPTPQRTLRPVTPPDAPRVPRRDVASTREALNGWVSESVRLQELLAQETTRLPNARPHATELQRLRTSAGQLYERSQRAEDVDDLLTDVQTFERDWRSLSSRLQQTSGLGNGCRLCVRSLDDRLGVLCDSLGIERELDTRELTRLLDSLTDDVHDLVDDMSLEIEPSRQRDQLLSLGRNAEQQCRSLSDAVVQGRSHAEILTGYRQWQVAWQPVAATLKPLGHRAFERHLRRIDEDDAAVRALLGQPAGHGRDRTGQLAHELLHAVDHLLDEVPLKVLVELGAQENLVSRASAFCAACEAFSAPAGESATVYRRPSVAELQQQWNDLATRLNRSRSPDVLRATRDVDVVLTALRDATLRDPISRDPLPRDPIPPRSPAAPRDPLPRPVPADRTALGRTGRLLENHIEAFEDALDEVVYDNAAYPRDFRKQTADLTESFQESAHRLRHALTDNAAAEVVRREYDATLAAWDVLYRHIDRITGADKARLTPFIQQIATQIADLRANLGR